MTHRNYGKVLSVKFLHIILTLTILPFFSVPQISYACGTIETVVNGYWEKNNLYGSPEKCLEILAASSKECIVQSTYKGDVSEKQILHVVIDVLKNRPNLKDLAKKIFLRWNCLYRARNEDGYKEVAESLGNENCNKYSNYLVVKAKNGANLRLMPDGNKLTTLPNYTLVSKIEQANGWVKVKVENYWLLYKPTCKYNSPCEVGYIHRSLLEEY